MPTSPGLVRFLLSSLLLAAGGCSVSVDDVPPWMRGPHWGYVRKSSSNYDFDTVAVGVPSDPLSSDNSFDVYGKTDFMSPSYSGASPSSETPVRVQVFPGRTFIVKTPLQDISLADISSVAACVEQNVPAHASDGGSQIVPIWARYDMPSDGIWFGLHSSPDDIASIADALIRVGYRIELDVDEPLRRQLISLGPYWSRIEANARFISAELGGPADLARSAPPDATSIPGFDDRMSPGIDPALNPSQTVPGIDSALSGFGNSTPPDFDTTVPGVGNTPPALGDSFPPRDPLGTDGSMPTQNPFGNNPFNNNPFDNNPFGNNTTEMPADLRALFGDQGDKETKSVLFSDDDLKLWQSIVFVVDIHGQNAWGDFAQSQVTGATGRLTAEQKGETVVNFWVTLQKFAAGAGLSGDSLESLIITALGKKPGVVYVMTDRDLPEEAVTALRNENQAGTRIEVRFFDDLFQMDEAKNLDNLASGTGGHVAHYKQSPPGQ